MNGASPLEIAEVLAENSAEMMDTWGDSHRSVMESDRGAVAKELVANRS